MSYWLRHRPDNIGIELDKNGWTDVKMFSEKSGISLQDIEAVVKTCQKQRYTLRGNFIRANQGHSVKVKLDFKEVTPPKYLYHGTVEQFIPSILKDGLKPMNRHHVHLSKDIETAQNVGGRRGKAVILRINTAYMLMDGIKFYISENGVYLVDSVDPVYLMRLD